MTKADVRAVFATVPGASLEELSRWKRSGYSIDTMNALRMAEITKQMREQGQTADPTQSLRDDDDDFDPADADDKDSHERAAAYHRACAGKADNWKRCIEQHRAADLHSAAAKSIPRFECDFLSACSKSKASGHFLMIASLEICMQKHREAAEALMAHFYSKNDDKGLELLDDGV